MKVIIADFYRVEREHIVYNMAMLSVLSSFKGVDGVRFLAQGAQIDLIRNEHKFESAEAIEFVKVPVYPRVGGVDWIKKIYYELKGVFSLLRSPDKDSLIFLTSLSPISSFFYKLLKVFYPKRKVIITLHGDIDFIQQNKTKFRNLLGKFFVWSFKMKDKNTKYLVLSNPIKANLVKDGFLSEEEVFAIKHPYFFDAEVKAKDQAKQPIRIGHLGVASTEKNTQLIFELAKNLEQEIRQNQVVFTIIGMNANIEGYKNDLVEFGSSTEMLSKASFNQKIGELDYAIFFYGDENYRFCSSGAILDAINHQIPVISIQNEGFQYMFNDAGGAIGFLCADLEEMIKLIRARILQQENTTDYAKMRDNLGAYQAQFSIENVKTQLYQQITPFLYGN